MFGITKQQLIGFIAAVIYRLYSFTFRYRIHAPEGVEIYGKQIIYAFWHQDDLCLIPLFANKNVVIMVSLSKDGRILATALEFFGFKTIAGSSSRRGIAAVIQAIKLIKSGSSFGIAVDGPRGPAFKSKDGVLLISQKTGKKILTAKAFPRKYFMFEKAWNRPKLPYPFSIIDVVIDKPKFFETTEELDKNINSLSL